MGSSCSSTRDVQERVELGSKKKRRSSGNEFSLLGHIRGSNGGVEDNSLLQVPGRIFANGGSKVSCLFTQQGKKGTNQDAMIVWENFDSRSDTIFCGVFDGHGPFGHMVAKKVRDSLPLKLSKQWNAILSNDPDSLASVGNTLGSTNSEENASFSLDDEFYESLEAEETKKLPEMYLPLKQSILKAFKIMDKELKLHPTLDCFCSGSTAVTLIKQGQDLVLGNVGDSRAVLATRDADNTLVAVQLTVDLKPNLPREAARIQQCKGRVFALQDEPEVARVWLPNSDSPGLAMARAFGDFCLKDFGLISVPDISYRQLTDKDEFIVLATDGIWDVLSNKEAIDVVASAPSRATAARALVDCANRAWRLKYPTSKVDDCAVVCLYIDHTSKETESTIENGAEPAPGMAESKNCAALSDDVSATQDSFPKQDIVHVDEIVPAAEGSVSAIVGSRSMRSLAECISATEDEEWSALEGVTRVNSLLSLPRFLSGDRRSASWRKWL